MVYICCFSLTIFAQSHFMVSGKVIGADKEPIIGATIQDKTNNIGVISDINGNFSIKASSRNATLHVSYIGMKSAEVKVEGKSTLTIVLEENTVKIDEVVVTALGIKREAKALGYAVSSVNNETLTAGNEQNVMSAISGKVAGVDISSTTAGPSGSTRVIIRGNSQLSGSNQPLYVIDGMPFGIRALWLKSFQWCRAHHDQVRRQEERNRSGIFIQSQYRKTVKQLRRLPACLRTRTRRPSADVHRDSLEHVASILGW